MVVQKKDRKERKGTTLMISSFVLFCIGFAHIRKLLLDLHGPRDDHQPLATGTYSGPIAENLHKRKVRTGVILYVAITMKDIYMKFKLVVQRKDRKEKKETAVVPSPPVA